MRSTPRRPGAPAGPFSSTSPGTSMRFSFTTWTFVMGFAMGFASHALITNMMGHGHPVAAAVQHAVPTNQIATVEAPHLGLALQDATRRSGSRDASTGRQAGDNNLHQRMESVDGGSGTGATSSLSLSKSASTGVVAGTSTRPSNGEVVKKARSDTSSAKKKKRSNSNKKVKFRGVFGPPIEDGPVLTTTGPRKGLPCQDCIFVAVTTCCKTLNSTLTIIGQLLRTDDNLHIALFDDMSTDDSKSVLEGMGLPVLQPEKGESVGLTKQMNLAWRYFYAREELSTMWVVNNDVQISPRRTFSKLQQCALSLPGPGVVGPMTNALGLGTGTHTSAYLSWQNAEHSRHKPLYGDVRIPEELTDNLPGSIVEYNEWLEDHMPGSMKQNATKHVLTLMGFVMGFRKDHPLHAPAENRMIHASRNTGQEYMMFQVEKINAYVCHNVFVYHDKSATNSPLVKAAMERNKQQVNKKGEVPGRQAR